VLAQHIGAIPRRVGFGTAGLEIVALEAVSGDSGQS
jgi:hypothetical protein